YVVLADGRPILYLERGGRSILTLPAAADPEAAHEAVGALARLVAEGRLRSLEVGRVDGLAVADSPLRDAFGAAGFRASYRGWVLRAATG
ncbi:MAG: ATP-dependent DNA helicase, partial [Candidatus Limnocylindrales bacterium]